MQQKITVGEDEIGKRKNLVGKIQKNGGKGVEQKSLNRTNQLYRRIGLEKFIDSI